MNDEIKVRENKKKKKNPVPLNKERKVLRKNIEGKKRKKK